MANEYNHPNRSRSMQRAKRRKTNIILNSLIVIVVLLIIIVGCTIFLSGGNDKKKSSSTDVHKQEQPKDTKQSTNKNSNDRNQKSSSNDNGADTNNSASSADDNNQINDSAEKDKGDQKLEKSHEVANEGSDSNVKKTYVNPGWAAVGTTQTNGHQYSSDQNSTDWQEKERAISYATGIPNENMTIWYLGRNSSDSAVVGTISSKDNKKIYRVYLEWEDGKGWKPTKVEELKENDRH